MFEKVARKCSLFINIFQYHEFSIYFLIRMCNFSSLQLVYWRYWEFWFTRNRLLKTLFFFVLDFPFFKFNTTFMKNLTKNHPFLRRILSFYEVLQRNWVLWCRSFRRLFENFAKCKEVSVFFDYFFWIEKMLQTNLFW